MIRSLARLALLLWAVIPVLITTVLLFQHPFARPFVERSIADARAALTLAMEDSVTAEWLLPRMENALQGDDTTHLRALSELAATYRVVLPAELNRKVFRALADQDGWTESIADCARCMTNINFCSSATMVVSCNIPFELSPAGDGAALLRQSWNWVKGNKIDEVEAALAGLGLAATVATVGSLGGSAPAKAGLTAVRVANRAGALSPGLRRSIIAATRDRKAARGILNDLSQIASAAPLHDTLAITRLADDSAELARLARLSKVAGKETRSILEVLGKPRSLRLLSRASDLVIATFGLLGIILAQILSVLMALAKLCLRRTVGRRSPTTVDRGSG